MNGKLLLLTMWFPYRPGEQFLEAEIEYLSKAFEQVYVLPTSHLGSKRSSPRRMPDNVELLADAVRDIQSQYARPKSKRALSVFRGRKYRAHCSRDARDILVHGPKALGKLLGFLSTSHLIFKAMRSSEKALQVALVYSYWLSAGTLSAITLREIGMPFKVVSRAHGWDLYHERQQPPYLPLQRFMVLNVDRLFPVSEHGLLYLQQRYPRARTVLSRLGVRKAPALSHPSEDGRLRVVTCSYIVPVKRLDLWVRALTLCQVPVIWTHIGIGPEEKKIGALAAGLPAHVQWRIIGELSNEAVLRYYATHSVDLFVNVSASEGLPVSIMEAFSFGIPVAATSAGGTGELVSSDNGILWSVDVSPEEIAVAIDNFAILPKGAKEQMRKAAVKTWESEVNADRQYSQFIKLLFDVCGPGE
jgi:glycosyltransferase involved in cell wall biosynthesis